MGVIIGMDEVGRGSWAGPVVVGAVLLTKTIDGLHDSKQLTKKQRIVVDQRIRQVAAAYGIGTASSQEIDELGLSASLKLAYERALVAIGGDAEQIIIDGNYNFLPEDVRVQTCIKADQLIPSVSAASVIAKVARDKLMAKLADTYPGYGFERHVGYGTTLHAQMLGQLGVCDIHRRSFRPVQRALAGAIRARVK